MSWPVLEYHEASGVRWVNHPRSSGFREQWTTTRLCLRAVSHPMVPSLCRRPFILRGCHWICDAMVALHRLTIHLIGCCLLCFLNSVTNASTHWCQTVGSSTNFDKPRFCVARRGYSLGLPLLSACAIVLRRPSMCATIILFLEACSAVHKACSVLHIGSAVVRHVLAMPHAHMLSFLRTSCSPLFVRIASVTIQAAAAQLRSSGVHGLGPDGLFLARTRT